MDIKLIARFDTDEGKRFTMTMNNPQEDLAPELVASELQKIIDLDVLAPSQGKPVSIHSAEIVETKVTTLI